MGLFEIEYNKVKAFSKLFNDYNQKSSHFADLISNFPNLENIHKQISFKSINYNHGFRDSLVKELYKQNDGIKLNEIQKQNINKLSEKNTYTITTGHQLNLLTGPVYFIYKIISIINLCEQMHKKYSEYNFVPIFWMASEDHDFEEINNFSFQGNKFKWSSSQTGVVGEFKLDSIDDVFNEFEKCICDYPHGDEIIKMFRSCYYNSKDFSVATRKLVNLLFSKYGLIIIDPNKKNLKSLFKDILKKELLEKTLYKESKKSTKRLNELNYNLQANPRKINLFYIDDCRRERIIEKENVFETSSGSKKWNLKEIQNEVDSNPEKFSPNVLFRPVFQEFILPNVCYVGGPAEIAYWLELKSVFESLKLSFPIILNRNSALLVEKKQLEKLDNLDVSIEEIFLPSDQLKEHLVRKYSKLELDFSDLKKQLNIQFSKLKDKASLTDKSFIGALNAQEKKQINGLKMLEKRLLKSEKRIHQDKINRVISIRDELFPGGKLQERISNFSEFYINSGEKLIGLIKNNLDPMNQKFSVIEI